MMLPARLFGGLRPAWRTARTLSRSSYQVQLQRQLGAFRANSSAASLAKAPKSPLTRTPEISDHAQSDPQEPRLAIAFTCTADGCNHRSAHTFTKRAYERGIVLIQCPSCENRHLIADNLGWFKDDTQDGRLKNIEDILRLRGEHVQRGTLDADGVVEFSES
ncbi:DNL zinc finger-domain-containing protein [Boletus edulis]|uniref:DNL zinc finger-domain-containing protein n=1 Tax=Boletus edulis BED1 TaxID=1328754 RepID=A0AAD4C5C0_BOLED|nr:DNL zinc finger-domain-containing protein [Boletus edulis]KAF8449361.1 DNL zinc finger-domain-containing protein [Boletus edulis BED1]